MCSTSCLIPNAVSAVYLEYSLDKENKLDLILIQLCGRKTTALN